MSTPFQIKNIDFSYLKLVIFDKFRHAFIHTKQQSVPKQAQIAEKRLNQSLFSMTRSISPYFIAVICLQDSLCQISKSAYLQQR